MPPVKIFTCLELEQNKSFFSETVLNKVWIMKYTWWILQVFFLLLSLFFFLFGISIMVSAYQNLNDPFTFIMTFFSASFMILISLTLAITFIIKMVRVYRSLNKNG